MSETLLRWTATAVAGPEPCETPVGEVVAFTRGCDPEAGNQDALGVLSLGGAGLLLVLADGAGGMPSGQAAAALAVDAMAEAASALSQTEASPEPGAIQQAVLGAFDRANDAIRGLGVGAASTLAAVTIEGRSLRSYHAGDSGVVVTGQRGRLRLATIAHSPTGYAVEAGYLSEGEALRHDERHLVSNLLGSGDMRIEIGPRLELAARDTVVVASDGLFDNLRTEEIAELVRTGPLPQAGARLRDRCLQRMQGSGEGRVGKVDDLTFLLLRPKR